MLKVLLPTVFVIVGFVSAHDYIETFHFNLPDNEFMQNDSATGFSKNCAPTHSIGSLINVKWNPKTIRTTDILTVIVDIDISNPKGWADFAKHCKKENPEVKIMLSLKFSEGDQPIVNVTDKMLCSNLMDLLESTAPRLHEYLSDNNLNEHSSETPPSLGSCKLIHPGERPGVTYRGTKVVFQCTKTFPDVLFLRYYTGSYIITVNATEEANHAILFCGSFAMDVSDQ